MRLRKHLKLFMVKIIKLNQIKEKSKEPTGSYQHYLYNKRIAKIVKTSNLNQMEKEQSLH